LRDIRTRRGKAQTEIADALGIDQTLVSAYERGTIRMHGAIVAAFAKVLRVSADEILGLKEIKDDTIFKDRRFIRRMERIDKLPKRAKLSLLNTIDTYLDGAEQRAR
jgi:transcriptional regulator with XRE-family HTH domain